MKYFKILLISVLCLCIIPFNIFAEGEEDIVSVDDMVVFDSALEENVDTPEEEKQKNNGVQYVDTKEEAVSFDFSGKSYSVPTVAVGKPQTTGQLVFICVVFALIAISIGSIAVWFFKLFRVYSDILEIDEDNTENVITFK